MGVGGLQHIFIGPVLGGHVGESVELSSGFRGLVQLPAQQGVGDGHRLRPGDLLVAPERAVSIAVNPPTEGGFLDIFGGPVAGGDVGKLPVLLFQGVVAALVLSEEPHGHGGELRPGHRVVAAEFVFLFPGDDAVPAEEPHLPGVPGAGGHVRKLGGGGAQGHALLVGQQPGEDHRGLGPGHGALRPKGAVRVPGDVGRVLHIAQGGDGLCLQHLTAVHTLLVLLPRLACRGLPVHDPLPRGVASGQLQNGAAHRADLGFGTGGLGAGGVAGGVLGLQPGFAAPGAGELDDPRSVAGGAGDLPPLVPGMAQRVGVVGDEAGTAPLTEVQGAAPCLAARGGDPGLIVVG